MARRRIVICLLLTVFLLSVRIADAQQPKAHRIGVVLHGGPWSEAVEGLKVGLKDLGLEEGKHFVLDIRDSRGELKALQEAARHLEREKVKLVYALTSSVVATAR